MPRLLDFIKIQKFKNSNFGYDDQNFKKEEEN